MCLLQLSTEIVKEALSIMNFHLWHWDWAQWKYQLLRAMGFLFLPRFQMDFVQINCSFDYFFFLSDGHSIAMEKHSCNIFIWKWEWCLSRSSKKCSVLEILCFWEPAETGYETAKIPVHKREGIKIYNMCGL